MSHKSTLGKYDNLACLQIPALSGKNVRWMKRRNVSDTYSGSQLIDSEERPPKPSLRI